jgi:von Willebrand factor type D domain
MKILNKLLVLIMLLLLSCKSKEPELTVSSTTTIFFVAQQNPNQKYIVLLNVTTNFSGSTSKNSTLKGQYFKFTNTDNSAINSSIQNVVNNYSTETSNLNSNFTPTSIENYLKSEKGFSQSSELSYEKSLELLNTKQTLIRDENSQVEDKIILDVVKAARNQVRDCISSPGPKCAKAVRKTINATGNLWKSIGKIISDAINNSTQTSSDDVYEEISKMKDDENLENTSDKIKANSWGDPHINTFDGLSYDFQAWGEFIAVKSTIDNFEVQVRQIGTENGPFSYNRGLAVQTGSDVVCFVNNNLYINNKVQSLNFTNLALKDNASLSITKDSRNIDLINIKSKYGDIVTIPKLWYDYQIQLSDSRKNKVIGLFGNYDGKNDNDLTLKNGDVIKLESTKVVVLSVEVPFKQMYPTYADSWRIEQKNSLFYYESGKNTDSFTNKNTPKEPVTITQEKKTWAEGVCKSAGITKEPFLSGCIMDVALTNDVSVASQSLWGQENNTTPNILQVSIGSDINYFKNIRVTLSENQGNLEDSCLVSFNTGKVFQLKEGAKNANLIDGIFLNVCSPTLHTPFSVITCGGSCGVGVTYNQITSQKWSTYKKGTVEFIGFAADDNPNDQFRVASSSWNSIGSSKDIENYFVKHYGAFTIESTLTYSNIFANGANCLPTTFLNRTLRRFLTQDNKKGVLLLNSYGKTKTGYWIDFDIKVQK